MCFEEEKLIDIFFEKTILESSVLLIFSTSNLTVFRYFVFSVWGIIFSEDIIGLFLFK